MLLKFTPCQAYRRWYAQHILRNPAFLLMMTITSCSFHWRRAEKLKNLPRLTLYGNALQILFRKNWFSQVSLKAIQILRNTFLSLFQHLVKIFNIKIYFQNH